MYASTAYHRQTDNMSAYAPNPPMPCYHHPNQAQYHHHPATPEPTANDQPRLVYYLSRSNGLPVPLVPADELPYDLKLQDVPRVLTPDQLHGLVYLGQAPYHGLAFKKLRDDSGVPMEQRSTGQGSGHLSAHTRSVSNPAGGQYLAPDTLARQALANANIHANSTAYASNRIPDATIPSDQQHSAYTAKRPASASESATSWRKSSPPHADTGDSLMDGILRTSLGREAADRSGYRPRDTTLPPSGKLPDQSKKEFCTYWMRTGMCDYTQQGCLYKHEMPEPAKLRGLLGTAETPAWYRERMAVVKTGGGRGIVGQVKKPEEWLRVRRVSDADSEASVESEVEVGSVGEKQEVVVLKKEGAKPAVVEEAAEVRQEVLVPKKESAKPTVVAKTAEVKPAVLVLKKESAKPAIITGKPAGAKQDMPVTKKESAKPAIITKKQASSTIPTSKPAPAAAPARKIFIHGNLIDFEVVDTTPSTSSSDTERLTPDSLPSTSPSAITIQASGAPARAAKPPTNKPTKVFVPAGESAEAHIHDARKRAARRHAKAASEGKVLSVTGLYQQVSEMQRQQKRAVSGSGGLWSSKHAPGSSSGHSGSSGAVKRGGGSRIVARPVVKEVQRAVGEKEVVVKG